MTRFDWGQRFWAPRLPMLPLMTRHAWSFFVHPTPCGIARRTAGGHDKIGRQSLAARKPDRCRTDQRFDENQLPPGEWDHRVYGNTACPSWSPNDLWVELRKRNGETDHASATLRLALVAFLFGVICPASAARGREPSSQYCCHHVR